MYARRSIAAGAAALLLCCAGPALAVDEIPDIETDRPDQTETATVVPAGSIQFEGGITFERELTESAFAGPMTTIMMPTALVRYGLFPVAELRVGFDYGVLRQRSALIDPPLSGPSAGYDFDAVIGAVSIGTKIALLDGEGGGPQAAVIADVEADPRDPADFVPGLRLSVAHDLGSGLSFGTNVAGSWDRNEELVTWAYTGALGYDISDILGGYVELFGEAADGMLPVHSLDAGLTLLRDANVQFDLAGGIGLSDPAPDYFIGAGVSFRMLPAGR